MATWYARPVIFVSDVRRSIEFYVGRIGFKQDWQYEEGGKPLVAQVSREGCELILSAQWPEKAGHGLMFISLDVQLLHTLRAELQDRGVDVTDGYWGYPLMVVRDLDGNELYFPYPNSDAYAPESPP
jgi:catechol 2,3-dioxygenase-like lactoylglutathione lyase family enzyme